MATPALMLSIVVTPDNKIVTKGTEVIRKI